MISLQLAQIPRILVWFSVLGFPKALWVFMGVHGFSGKNYGKVVFFVAVRSGWAWRKTWTERLRWGFLGVGRSQVGWNFSQSKLLGFLDRIYFDPPPLDIEDSSRPCMFYIGWFLRKPHISTQEWMVLKWRILLILQKSGLNKPLMV